MSISLTGSVSVPSLSIPGAGPRSFALAAGCAIFAVVLWLPVVLSDPDTLWHITVGDWILAHGAVPTIDAFSFTAEGRPWVAQEWLSEVILALGYGAAGWAGILILTAAAAGLAAGIVALRLRRALRCDIALMVLLLAVSCAGSSLLARPHLLALPCLALWSAALIAARDRGEAPSLLLWPLMALWANLHGGFMIGLVLAGALAVEALCDPASDRRTVVRQWGVFIVGSLLAACITPHGIDGLLFPLRLLAMKNLYKIQEWMPGDLGHVTGLTVSILLGLYLGLTTGQRLPRFRVCLLLGLLFQAMAHGRNEQVFGVMAPLLVAGCLGKVSLGEVSLGKAAAALRFPRVERFAGAAMVLAAVVSVSIRAAVAMERPDGGYYASAALEHVPARLRLRPVLNEYGFGGMLIFSGIRPYIDGRADLYGDAGLGAYLDIIGGRANALDAALCKYDIAWTIFPPDTLVPALMDRTAGWRRIYSDKTAVIHVRDSDKPRAACRNGLSPAG